MPRQPEGSAQQTVEVTDALMDVSRLMTSVVARSLAGVDEQLSVPQFRVLVMLWAGGPMNISGIAEGLAVNVSNASRACDKLSEAGLAERRVDPGDRRTVRVRLTPAGRSFVDQVMAARRSLLASIVAGLEPGDQALLARALRALLEEVDRSGHAERIGVDPGAIAPWVL